jgi:hypothetical protein
MECVMPTDGPLIVSGINRGYTPIEQYGIIGELQTAALISTKGSIDWRCSPRFDSPLSSPFHPPCADQRRLQPRLHTRPRDLTRDEGQSAR